MTIVQITLFLVFFLIIVGIIFLIRAMQIPAKVKKAEELLENDDHSTANEIVKAILEKKNDYVPARYLKAKILIKQKQYILAISELNSVLTLPEFQKHVSELERFKKHMKLNLIYVDASKRFLDKLKGVKNPEKKRKIIGREFVKVFMKEAKKINRFDFLAQGTLYPDVIESVSTRGPSDTIKSHHNRVPEIIKLIKSGKIIEPLKELFKDEVRELGIALGMPEELVYRHPFPGPGLAIRIIGPVTRKRISMLQEADDILIVEIKNAGIYRELWQVFAVLLPVKSVGVMGDKRTYENVIAIRGVTSVDAMTADWAYLPEDLMRRISNRIINEVKGINRVVYDISSKPPSTIEWE